MSPRSGMSYVEIGVTELERSLDFYRGLLGLRPGTPPHGPALPGEHWLSAEGAMVKLVEAPTGSTLGGWVGDDLQGGMRHFGMKVGDVHRQAERIRDAGVVFSVEPTAAVGDVNLAFFRDPDGTLLEIIDGHLHYHKVFDDALADSERHAARTRPPNAPPVFDHVAVTVPDIDAALSFYGDELGYPLIGQLVHDQDPRGFVIHYLQAGSAVLEVFSFNLPTAPSPWTAQEERLGLRGIGLTVRGVRRTVTDLVAAGAVDLGGTHRLRSAGDALLTDPAGVPLHLLADR